MVITASDTKVNPSIEALQMYAPLSDGCIGLNYNWLVVDVEVIVMESVVATGVLPSGGSSH